MIDGGDRGIGAPEVASLEGEFGGPVNVGAGDGRVSRRRGGIGRDGRRLRW